MNPHIASNVFLLCDTLQYTVQRQVYRLPHGVWLNALWRTCQSILQPPFRCYFSRNLYRTFLAVFPSNLHRSFLAGRFRSSVTWMAASSFSSFVTKHLWVRAWVVICCYRTFMSSHEFVHEFSSVVTGHEFQVKASIYSLVIREWHG